MDKVLYFVQLIASLYITTILIKILRMWVGGDSEIFPYFVDIMFMRNGSDFKY